MSKYCGKSRGDAVLLKANMPIHSVQVAIAEVANKGFQLLAHLHTQQI